MVEVDLKLGFWIQLLELTLVSLLAQKPHHLSRCFVERPYVDHVSPLLEASLLCVKQLLLFRSEEFPLLLFLLHP